MDLSDLFADLEQQLGTELDLELRDQLGDEERQRQARLTLRERIRLMSLPRGISTREPLQITLVSGRQLRLSPVTHGRDWIAADVHSSMGHISHAVIPLSSVLALHPSAAQQERSLGDPVTSISREDVASLSPAPARLTDAIGFGYVLRDLARRRKPVEVVLVHEAPVRGTIDRVGADHLDLSLADRSHIIPLAQIELVTLL